MRQPPATPFRARYDGKEILEAVEDIQESGSLADALAIPFWESQLMLAMRMTEEDYMKMPRQERARKIVTMNLPTWWETLETVRLRAERAKKGKK